MNSKRTSNDKLQLDSEANPWRIFFRTTEEMRRKRRITSCMQNRTKKSYNRERSQRTPVWLAHEWPRGVQDRDGDDF